MRKSLLYIVLAATLAAALATALTLPAAATEPSDTNVTVPTVSVPSTPVTDIQIPTVTVPTVPTTPTVPTVPTVPGSGTTGPGGTTGPAGSTTPTPTGTQPSVTGPTATTPGSKQKGSNPSSTAKTPTLKVHLSPVKKHHKASPNGQKNPALYQPNGTPSPSNPTFTDALPPSLEVTAVPNFVISQFHVPPFLLPIYQAAGIQYGIRWEVLAAINEIETDYGRNLNVSSAGAVGWMQFIPSSWRAYGVDANKDGKKDPYNPVDAIFAAARYLKAAGGDKNIKKAIFAYNHAGWYVDSVMLRAKLLSGVPAPLIDSLTGLTEGRFPVAAHARYADDLVDRKLVGKGAKKDK